MTAKSKSAELKAAVRAFENAAKAKHATWRTIAPYLQKLHDIELSSWRLLSDEYQAQSISLFLGAANQDLKTRFRRCSKELEESSWNLSPFQLIFYFQCETARFFRNLPTLRTSLPDFDIAYELLLEMRRRRGSQGHQGSSKRRQWQPKDIENVQAELSQRASPGSSPEVGQGESPEPTIAPVAPSPAATVSEFILPRSALTRRTKRKISVSYYPPARARKKPRITGEQELGAKKDQLIYTPSTPSSSADEEIQVFQPTVRCSEPLEDDYREVAETLMQLGVVGRVDLQATEIGIMRVDGAMSDAPSDTQATISARGGLYSSAASPLLRMDPTEANDEPTLQPSDDLLAMPPETHDPHDLDYGRIFGIIAGWTSGRDQRSVVIDRSASRKQPVPDKLPASCAVLLLNYDTRLPVALVLDPDRARARMYARVPSGQTQIDPAVMNDARRVLSARSSIDNWRMNCYRFEEGPLFRLALPCAPSRKESSVNIPEQFDSDNTLVQFLVHAALADKTEGLSMMYVLRHLASTISSLPEARAEDTLQVGGKDMSSQEQATNLIQRKKDFDICNDVVKRYLQGLQAYNASMPDPLLEKISVYREEIKKFHNPSPFLKKMYDGLKVELETRLQDSLDQQDIRIKTVSDIAARFEADFNTAYRLAKHSLSQRMLTELGELDRRKGELEAALRKINGEGQLFDPVGDYQKAT